MYHSNHQRCLVTLDLRTLPPSHDFTALAIADITPSLPPPLPLLPPLLWPLPPPSPPLTDAERGAAAMDDGHRTAGHGPSVPAAGVAAAPALRAQAVL